GRLLGSGMDEVEIIVEAVADNEPVNFIRPHGSEPAIFSMYNSLFTHLGFHCPLLLLNARSCISLM
ncbi:hypothetical protein A2U01_0054936, partial [Trifolium medium]|nr:hypothetical protein [Trifolium medium]